MYWYPGSKLALALMGITAIAAYVIAFQTLMNEVALPI